MPPLYEQRSNLISQNVSLIQRWLALLPTEEQRNVIESMVRRFSLPELRAMREHVAAEVAKKEDPRCLTPSLPEAERLSRLARGPLRAGRRRRRAYRPRCQAGSRYRKPMATDEGNLYTCPFIRQRIRRFGA